MSMRARWTERVAGRAGGRHSLRAPDPSARLRAARGRRCPRSTASDLAWSVCECRGVSVGVDERWGSPVGGGVRAAQSARRRQPQCGPGKRAAAVSTPGGRPAVAPRPGRRAKGFAGPGATAAAAYRRAARWGGVGLQSCRPRAGRRARSVTTGPSAGRLARRRLILVLGRARGGSARTVAARTHPAAPPGAPPTPLHHPSSLWDELGRPGPLRDPRHGDRIARR
jgi:hypothetical protein